MTSLEMKIQLTAILKLAGTVLGTLAVAAGTILLGALALAMLLPALLIAAVVVLEPILVAVMDDDTWIEIDRC